MDTNQILVKIMIESMAANSKLTALASIILEENQREDYNTALNQIWRDDLLKLHDNHPHLFSQDALDDLISLFE